MAERRVALLDYGAGNLRSIGNALRAVGADVRLASHPREALDASHLVFPGVGAFGAAMGSLRASGLDATLEAHRAAGRPLLGVCVGFQAMFARGTEFGEHAGLGWFAGSVDRFAPGLHVPHVGWNRVAPVEGRDGPLWRGLEAGWFAYFVHSYRPTGVDEADIAATTEYGGSFASAVARDHVAGVQFHPEKSGPDGLRLLSNFVAWSP